jgi:hypothetical protein
VDGDHAVLGFHRPEEPLPEVEGGEVGVEVDCVSGGVCKL